MKREDIADHLGLNSETVSRIVTRLRKRGVLTLPRPGHAVLLNTQSMRDMMPLDILETT